MSPTLPSGIDVLFVAGFGPIVTDSAASERLYGDVLKLPLIKEADYAGYCHTQAVEGVKHFALWPLDKASLSCFGTERWPDDVPVPQCWMEFDVADIETATRALEVAGYSLLTRARKEPWGQTVTRFLSPEGILTALCHTPHLRTEP